MRGQGAVCAMNERLRFYPVARMSAAKCGEAAPDIASLIRATHPGYQNNEDSWEYRAAVVEPR